jgi:hypothetical protein
VERMNSNIRRTTKIGTPFPVLQFYHSCANGIFSYCLYILVTSSLPHSLCSLTSQLHCSTLSAPFVPEDRNSTFSKLVTQHHILEVQLPHVQPLLHGAYAAFVVLFRYQDQQLLSPYATVFITDMVSVHCAVCTEALYRTDTLL